MTWLNVHDLNTEVTFITWYEYEMKHQDASDWTSTHHHADTVEDLIKRPPERKRFEFRVVRKTLTTEVI